MGNNDPRVYGYSLYVDYEEVTGTDFSSVFCWLRDVNCLSNSSMYPLSS